MLFPVRCFTCGSVIGDKYEEYKDMAKKLGNAAALDKMGFKRYCCRRMFLSHVDIASELLPYDRL
jgi:DNA-directed RNA polymerase subunit N (RpoN/RPB10)